MVLQDLMQQPKDKLSEPTEVQGSVFVYQVTEELKKSREDLVSKKRIQLLTSVQELWVKNAKIPESFRAKYNL